MKRRFCIKRPRNIEKPKKKKRNNISKILFSRLPLPISFYFFFSIFSFSIFSDPKKKKEGHQQKRKNKYEKKSNQESRTSASEGNRGGSLLSHQTLS